MKRIMRCYLKGQIQIGDSIADDFSDLRYNKKGIVTHVSDEGFTFNALNIENPSNDCWRSFNSDATMLWESKNKTLKTLDLQ